MEPPPGYNPSASLLPDPGPSVPIHSMSGGDDTNPLELLIGSRTSEQEKALSEFGLESNEKAQLSKDDIEKFMTALGDDSCKTDIGVILKKECEGVRRILSKKLLNIITTSNKSNSSNSNNSDEIFDNTPDNDWKGGSQFYYNANRKLWYFEYEKDGKYYRLFGNTIADIVNKIKSYNPPPTS
jgi:hypothetical protein